MPHMVRINPATHRALVGLAEQSNCSLQQALEMAVEQHRRRLLLARANAGYARLRADKKAWQNWKRELQQLDATLSDGI
jgi:hypothetical protein